MSEATRLDDWDPRAPDVLGDQIASYDRMRGRCPVAHSDYLGWSAFRHGDVVDIIEDHETYSSAVSAAHPAVPNGYDPPQHGVYRELVNRFFDDDEVDGYETAFTSIARELVEGLPHNDDTEFIDGFALNYALRTQQAWLDWPDYTITALREWMVNHRRATLSGDRTAITAVANDFDTVVRRVIAEKRERGGEPGDVTARLMRESIDGTPIGEDLIVSILRNWTVGELGTMAASVGIVANYLANNPELQQQLRDDPSELPAAIDEILRIHAPLISNRRVTSKAVTLGGRDIDAGERLTIFWASANRDEAVFGDPDAYRPHENAANNLLYGRGIHYCPGERLAKLELRVALEALLAGTRSIRPGRAVPTREAAYPASGYETLGLHIRRGAGRHSL